MGEIGEIDAGKVIEDVRTEAGKDAFDVYRTGDRLGMLSHPDKQTANHLKEFFPRVLEGLLDLEEKVGQSRAGEVTSGRELSPKAQEEYDHLLQLTTAVSRVLYYPEPGDTWFLSRYGRSFSSESSVLAYPQRGLHPTHLDQSYDFQSPSTWRLQVDDSVNGQKVFFEVFPTRFAPYPPKYASVEGSTAEVAKQHLSELRVNPQSIKSMVDFAESRAKEPHLAIRLEGRDGKPISRIEGDLASIQDRGRTVLGLKFHLAGANPDGEPKDPGVAALEKSFVFLPLPDMKKDPNVPLAPLARAVVGLKMKNEFQVRPAQQRAVPRSA